MRSKNKGLDNGLVLNRRQAIIQNNNDPIQRRSYAALGDMSKYLFAIIEVETITTKPTLFKGIGCSEKIISIQFVGYMHIEGESKFLIKIVQYHGC